MPEQELRRRVARGAFWAAIETWGAQVMILVLFLVLARLLGPEIYGLMGLALVPTLLGQALILNGGWLEALVRRPEKELAAAHLDAAFWVLVALGLTLGTIMVLAAGPLARLIGAPELAAVLRWLALSFPLASLTVVPVALLQRRLDIAPLAIRSSVSIGVSGSVGIAMALAGYGIWSLVVAEILRPALGVLILWLRCDWRPRPRFVVARAAELGRFAVKVLGDRLVVVAEMAVPRLVIGNLLGAGPLGFWLIGRKLYDTANDAVQRPLMRVAMPGFSHGRGDAVRLSEMVRVGGGFLLVALVPVYLGLAVIAPDLIPLLLGETWRPAAAVLQVLALAGLVMPIRDLNAQLLLTVDRAGVQLAVSITGLAIFVMLIALLAGYGLVGIAAAFVLRAWLTLPLSLWLVRRATGLQLGGLLRTALGPFAAGLTMVLALVAADMWLLPPDLPITAHLGLTILIGAIVYLAVLALVARSALGEAVAGLQAAIRPRPPTTASIGSHPTA